MKRLGWISLICLLTTLARGAHCFGQCNPHPSKPNWLPPCASFGYSLSQAIDAANEINKLTAILNHDIGDARRNLWRLYPDKPGFEAAELEFYKQLLEKDLYYLMFALQGGMSDRATRMPNVVGLLNGSVAPEDLDKFPKTVDGGIKPFAFPLFAAWVDALRRAEGREKDGTFATPFILATAIKDRSNWRKAYEEARDWAEFISSGLDISKYVTPHVYLLHQMEADVSSVLARSKPAELPDPTVSAKELYDLLVKMFGEKEVVAAATAVLHAPKNSVGGLATRAEVSIGTFEPAPSPNPYLMFLTRLTNSTPRNFGISLCMDQYAMLGGEARYAFNSKDQWDKAFNCYSQLVEKYGERNFVDAAKRLQGADRDSEGHLKADPDAKGLVFWFATLIKDPKATIPDARLPHFHASSYDSHWLGKTIEVRGTVASVDLATGKFPPYATIHFKEARGDAMFAYTPNSDMWQETYGNNFERLIGKAIEVWGHVTEWKEGAGVEIIRRDQLKILDATAASANFTDSHPDWLNGSKPEDSYVDSPKYLAWKKFPVGTTVSYQTRLLHEYQPGANLYTRTKISLDTFRLESIDEKRAVVMVDTTVWHRTGGASTSQTKLVYPAKESPGMNPPPPPNESGDEVLEISGKKFPAHWKSVWERHYTTDRKPDPQTFTKTWTSDDVPSGIVLTHQQSHTNITDQEYRNITETILVPDASVEPELGSSSARQITPGAPAAQPATPNRNAPASEPVRAGQGKGAAVGSTAAALPAGTAPPVGTTANRSIGTVATAIPVTPALGQIVPPISRRQPPVPVTPTQALSPQAEFAKHYHVVTIRALRAKVGLAQRQQRQGAPSAELPEDVRAARDRLNAQQQAVFSAISARDNSLAEQRLNDMEETLKVIEQFLTK
jgi:hypothetical protein